MVTLILWLANWGIKLECELGVCVYARVVLPVSRCEDCRVFEGAIVVVVGLGIFERLFVLG